eukprot:984609-Amphidinium_carterae.1
MDEVNQRMAREGRQSLKTNFHGTNAELAQHVYNRSENGSELKDMACKAPCYAEQCGFPR